LLRQKAVAGTCFLFSPDVPLLLSEPPVCARLKSRVLVCAKYDS